MFDLKMPQTAVVFEQIDRNYGSRIRLTALIDRINEFMQIKLDKAQLPQMSKFKQELELMESRREEFIDLARRIRKNEQLAYSS